MRTRSNKTRRELIEALRDFFSNIPPQVDVILVEGLRDVEALRSLGYTGELMVCSQIGVNDYDLMSEVSRRYSRVLVLTDFDQEGVSLSQKFSNILEHEGVVVEKSLRSRVGGMMAGLGVYAIEDLDNIVLNVDNGQIR